MNQRQLGKLNFDTLFSLAFLTLFIDEQPPELPYFEPAPMAYVKVAKEKLHEAYAKRRGGGFFGG